ncbi:MAG: DUF4442 domain-containing protein [Pseudomonadota bacterium]
MRALMNLRPPFVGAGIRLREIAPDRHYARVEFAAWRWKRNVVGTRFGGSLFAMTRLLAEYVIEVHDAGGETVARVRKKLYVRLKRDRRPAAAGPGG